MQITGAGMNAAYTAAIQSSQAKINPEVNAAATEAAAQATAAMYGLVSAVGGAQEAVQNIAAGQLSSAVDIMA